jgi:hypothetical protein
MPSEMTPEEIKQLIRVLDSALLSDAPAVVSALQNLVLVTSLVAENKTDLGPLQKMLNQINNLQRDVDRLMHEQTKQYIESTDRENYKKKYQPGPGW